MRDYQKIAFGSTIGSLVCVLILTIVFGNEREVLYVLPVTVASAIIYASPWLEDAEVVNSSADVSGV